MTQLDPVAELGVNDSLTNRGRCATKEVEVIDVKSEVLVFEKSLNQIGRRGKVSYESGGKSTIESAFRVY